jgi:hypothetical protein
MTPLSSGVAGRLRMAVSRAINTSSWHGRWISQAAEEKMKQTVSVAVLMFVGGTGVFAADQTFTGAIGDSRCGASHKAMQEHDKNLSDRACTEACIKGGAKYVLSSGGKVYEFDNQNDPALTTYAGQQVTVTGELQSNTIRASKISKVNP